MTRAPTILPPGWRWCVLCDIDGTLADNRHRAHFIERPEGEKDWDSFFAASGDDTPVQPVVAAFHALQMGEPTGFSFNGSVPILLTGRTERHRHLTETWLTRHGIAYDRLFMRADGDHRPDVDFKREALQTIRQKGYEPWIVLEDRKSVVEMWRKEGLTCLQVADGEF